MVKSGKSGKSGKSKVSNREYLLEIAFMAMAEELSNIHDTESWKDRSKKTKESYEEQIVLQVVDENLRIMGYRDEIKEDAIEVIKELIKGKIKSR